MKKKPYEQKRYKEYVQRKMPERNHFSTFFKAYLVGGLICTFGQALSDLAKNALLLDESDAAAFVAIALIFLGALFTGLGVYDDLGKFAGAGSVVPITGFANSVVSPAMEFKREGLVMGVGAKMFILAGPVIVYGVGSSVVFGLIYALAKGAGWA